LRFFKMTVPPSGNASRFNATVTSASDAPALIASVIGNLTSGNGSVNGDFFDPSPSQTGLSQDEDLSALEFNQQDDSGNFVFNFAVARVRLLAKSAATAKNVRVFFRLFQAQNTVSNFDTSTTYRFATDGTPFGHRIPRLGVQNDQNGNPEYVTIPCFATPRIVLTDPTKSMDDQDDPPNAHDLATSPGAEKDYFFGCWIDNNQPTPIMPASPPTGNFDGPWPAGSLQSMKVAMTAFPHQCMIAEIRYDDTPIPVGATTTTSDKLAQRNIAWLDGPNPGLPASRRMVHPVQIRATPTSTIDPDELMILWGSTPQSSLAQLYLPALNAADIVQLADERYTLNSLSVLDAHTIGFKASGVTFIPLPKGAGLAAGLLSIDLPPTVHKGDVYTISVRQLTDAAAKALPPPPPPPPVPQVALGNQAATVFLPPRGFVWRRVEGAFQFVITIKTKQQLLLPEERLLAVLRWMLLHTSPQKRWYPVLQRYIHYVVGLVQGHGGDPGTIQPSPTGDVPGLHLAPTHGPKGRPQHEDGEETCGKIWGILYDHFGDFEGFIVEGESGHHRRFFSRESAMLAI